MAKINPITGKMSGKVGGLVFSVNRGIATVREKNPSPFNPRSERQVEVRAKLKLLSQLSAVLSPVVAFRRIGAISPRNMFTRTNYAAIADATITDGNISVVTGLENLDLTGGITLLPNMAAITVSQGVASIALNEAAADDIDNVTYGVLNIQEDGRATLIEAKVVETAGTGRTFPTTVTLPHSVQGTMVVYAYGAAIMSENARTIYEDYKCKVTGVQALLNVIRQTSESDVRLTVTRAAVFTQA